MKEISYLRGQKKFLLTEKEYLEAFDIWSSSGCYLCPRLGNAALPANIDWTDTPDEDKGCDEIYFLVNGDTTFKIFKRRGKYYYRQTNLAVYEKEFPKEAFDKAKNDGLLINKEKYYQEKMYEK